MNQLDLYLLQSETLFVSYLNYHLEDVQLVSPFIILNIVYKHFRSFSFDVCLFVYCRAEDSIVHCYWINSE